jgi:hypothetical protein
MKAYVGVAVQLPAYINSVLHGCMKQCYNMHPSFENAVRHIGPRDAVGGDPIFCLLSLRQFPLAHINQPKAFVAAPVITRLLLPKYVLAVWLEDQMGNIGACIGGGNKKLMAIWEDRSILSSLWAPTTLLSAILLPFFL